MKAARESSASQNDLQLSRSFKLNLLELLPLQELGIDISDAPQQKLTAEVAQQAALLVTMGCGEACPYVPGQCSAVARAFLPPAHQSRIQVHLHDTGANCMTVPPCRFAL
jgi:protein-tyrosine-phosphatase